MNFYLKAYTEQIIYNVFTKMVLRAFFSSHFQCDSSRESCFGAFFLVSYCLPDISTQRKEMCLVIENDLTSKVSDPWQLNFDRKILSSCLAKYSSKITKWQNKNLKKFGHKQMLKILTSPGCSKSFHLTFYKNRRLPFI